MGKNTLFVTKFCNSFFNVNLISILNTVACFGHISIKIRLKFNRERSINVKHTAKFVTDYEGIIKIQNSILNVQCSHQVRLILTYGIHNVFIFKIKPKGILNRIHSRSPVRDTCTDVRRSYNIQPCSSTEGKWSQRISLKAAQSSRGSPVSSKRRAVSGGLDPAVSHSHKSTPKVGKDREREIADPQAEQGG